MDIFEEKEKWTEKNWFKDITIWTFCHLSFRERKYIDLTMVFNEIKQRNKLYIPGSPCEIFNKEIIKKTKKEKKLIDESLSVIKAWQGQQACYFTTKHQNQKA